MGWAGGTYVAEPVVKSAKRNIKDKKARARFYKDFLAAMDDADWDTHDEVMGIDKVFDDVLREVHPSFSDDD